MEKFKALVKRYRFFLIVAASIGVVTLINTAVGLKALAVSAYQFRQMLLVLPPILSCLGFWTFGCRGKRSSNIWGKVPA
jgi:hypothetical protein